ncbi:MAG: DUF3293 domain-containing protein [Lysobacterales bacterium]
MNPISTAPVVTAELILAYANACYEIEHEGRWISAEQLTRKQTRGLPWSLISACNPRSQQLPDALNEARQQQLRDWIDAAGAPWQPARGRAADFSWLEPGFLVAAELHRVDNWARAFEQHAIWLPATATTPAIMRIYAADPGPEHRLQLPHVRLEWVGFGPTSPE